MHHLARRGGAYRRPQGQDVVLGGDTLRERRGRVLAQGFLGDGVEERERLAVHVVVEGGLAGVRATEPVDLAAEAGLERGVLGELVDGVVERAGGGLVPGDDERDDLDEEDGWVVDQFFSFGNERSRGLLLLTLSRSSSSDRP